MLLDSHAIDRQSRHACGGTLLTGLTAPRHEYCDTCGAYTCDLSRSVPDGTDAAANREAWESGDETSPDAD